MLARRGQGLGAQPLLLSVDDPAEGRDDSCPHGRSGPAPRMAAAHRSTMTARPRATAASRAGSRLTTGLGLDRDFVISTRGILPATRFAVEAYVHFCRDRTPARGHRLLAHRTVLAADHRRADRGHAAPLRFRDARTRSPISPSARRRRSAIPSSRSIMCKAHAQSEAEQRSVLAALSFKCDVLWVQFDALWHAYVDGPCPAGRLACREAQ